MKIDWGLALTLVTALFLYSVVERAVYPSLFRRTTSSVTPLKTGNSLEDYILENYPDAKR